MLHVFDISQILANECPTLEKRVSPSIKEGRGIKLSDEYNKYPNAIVSAVHIQFKDVGSNRAGFPVTSKEIIAEFEVLLRFNANVDLNNTLNEAAIITARKNITTIQQTMIEIVNALQSRQVNLLECPAYVNVGEFGYVHQSNDGATKVEIAYALHGEVMRAANFNRAVYQDNSQGDYSLINKANLRAVTK
jgi:hypothetical protein